MKRPSPALLLGALPDAAAALVAAILEAADRRDTAVYAVGGPVRDLLLGRDLADVDLLVEGDAAALGETIEFADVRMREHDRFGTVALETADASIDLATARRESYAHDGALPTVSAGNLDEDLRRRDFTINAMALPLSRRARAGGGGVIDVDGGMRDLKEGRLRVLHPRSFHDDPTRALRAARLAPRLGFSLTRGSRGALRDALRDGAFSRVSGDRLRRELAKMFSDASLGLDPAKGLRLLNDWHVLGALEPGLHLPREAQVALRRVGRSVTQPPWRTGRWRPWVTGLAVWLGALTPALRRRSLTRLGVRGETATRIAEFPKRRDAWARALQRARGRGAVDAALAGVSEEELLALLASTDSAVRRRIVRFAGEDRQRRLPITGDDLMAIGLAGPAIGRALRKTRTAYLDGSVKTRDELLALGFELGRRARNPRRPKGEAATRRG